MFPLHLPLRSLPWFLDMALVMLMVAILEEEDEDLLEVDMARMEVDRGVSEKAPQQCRHCQRSNHISEKCWKKFSRFEWAQYLSLALLICVALLEIVHPLSSLFLDLPHCTDIGGV